MLCGLGPVTSHGVVGLAGGRRHGNGVGRRLAGRRFGRRRRMALVVGEAVAAGAVVGGGGAGAGGGGGGGGRGGHRRRRDAVLAGADVLVVAVVAVDGHALLAGEEMVAARLVDRAAGDAGDADAADARLEDEIGRRRRRRQDVTGRRQFGHGGRHVRHALDAVGVARRRRRRDAGVGPLLRRRRRGHRRLQQLQALLGAPQRTRRADADGERRRGRRRGRSRSFVVAGGDAGVVAAEDGAAAAAVGIAVGAFQVRQADRVAGVNPTVGPDLSTVRSFFVHFQVISSNIDFKIISSD